MTASTPTILHADPARTADELRTPAGGIDPTAALVQGLEQTPAASASVSPIVAFVVGLLTFGMVPLWLWHHRLREHILDQQAQLRRTAAWLAWKTGRAEALDLRRLADEAGWRGAIGLASLICLPVILCFLFLYFTRVGALDLHTLLAITYRFGSRHHWSLPGTPAPVLFAVDHWVVPGIHGALGPLARAHRGFVPVYRRLKPPAGR